jgi:hypothetical protein
MHRLLLVRSSLVLVGTLAAGVAHSATAQNSASSQTQGLKARCEQLITYFDRYGGTGRSEDSDGARNHTRIGAAVDCQTAQYDKGISEMDALLTRKRYDVPPAVSGLAQAPAPPSRSPPAF